MNCIDSFIATHTPHIQILMEVLLTVFHGRACHVTGLYGQMGMLVCCILVHFFPFVRPLQLL